jgi:hypothetical protein
VGLIPRTNYTVQVRAVHLHFFESVFFTNGPLATVTATTNAPPGMYLTDILMYAMCIHSLQMLVSS